MSAPASTRHALGRTLVALQFSLLGALAWWALPALRAAPVPALPILLPLLASAALGLWALATVLLAKARLEERWLMQMHVGYAAYCRRTRRFVPGLI